MLSRVLSCGMLFNQGMQFISFSYFCSDTANIVEPRAKNTLRKGNEIGKQKRIGK